MTLTSAVPVEDKEAVWNSVLGEDGTTRPPMRSRLLTRAQLDDLPAPTPLIDDTLDQRTVALLVGNRSTGKTFIALDWACNVATGTNWQGRTAERGRVLYVAAEGAHGLAQRVGAWEAAWNHAVVDLDVYPEPVNLTDRAAVEELIALADPYTLVILDTLARCAVGADENSARDMGIVVDAAYRIRGTGPRTVLLVHHTGKDRETTRGSSALEAGVDTVYLVEGDSQLLRMSRTKRKDGPLDDVHNLRLSESADSVIVASARGGQIEALRATADKLLSTFVSTFGDGTATKAELRTVAEMPPASFHRALKDLVKTGLLLNEGSDKRPVYRASRPEQPW